MLKKNVHEMIDVRLKTYECTLNKMKRGTKRLRDENGEIRSELKCLHKQNEEMRTEMKRQRIESEMNMKIMKTQVADDLIGRLQTALSSPVVNDDEYDEFMTGLEFIVAEQGEKKVQKENQQLNQKENQQLN